MAKTDVIPATAYFQQSSTPYADSSYKTSPRPAGGPPDKLLDFGSVANGADLSSTFSYWGQKGTSYGTEGDTSIFPPGSTSSAKMSIQQGSDGLSEFTTNGTFGGGVNDTDGWNLGEGDELYTGIWMYVPVGFSWRTNTTAVKFLRHNYVGKTTKLDVQILHSGNADQQGWKILNEEFPQAEANDARDTSVIMEEGEWSFITFYTYFHSDPNLAIVRLSKGQEFIYERSGTNLKFRNSSGNIQTDTVLGLPTLHDSATKFAGTMIYTYWNGGNTTHSGTYPLQDQQVNMKSFGFKLAGSGIFDDQGNEVLDGGVF